MPGRYQDLKAIIDANRKDAEIYNNQPPDACPRCGNVLIERNGIRNCPDGHYRWQGGPRET